MHKQHIIALNGPPGSGKDTVAELLLDQPSLADKRVAVLKFATPLREMVTTITGIPDHEIDEHKKTLIGYDYTVRQLMIDLSESLIKPKINQNYFAIRVADEVLESDADVVFITDAGFQYEVEACFDSIKARTDRDVRFAVWNVERLGMSFEGDSRSFVSDSELMNGLGVDFSYLSNNSTIERLGRNAEWLLIDLLEGREEPWHNLDLLGSA
jgi:hypothetical protein